MGFHSKPNTFVGHVKIKVKNLEDSLKFYLEVIGFHILERTKTGAKLTTDGKTSVLSLEQPANVISKKARTTGLYHFAILLPQRSDLANIVLHFRENGIRIRSSDHLVSEALYLSDPDGNGIEIYADRDPSEWSWMNGIVVMSVDPLNFENLLSSANQQQWKGLPSNTVMGHIHLHVSELQKAEDFYTNGLGFEVVNRYGTQALFISSGKYHHHIGLNTWNGVGAPPPPANSVGLEFFTLVFNSKETLVQIASNLKKMGAPVTEENGIFVTLDPSGNVIHLQV